MKDHDNNSYIKHWLNEKKIEDVEILVCDFAGNSRGKRVTATRFVNALGSDSLRLPDSVFGITIDCNFITNKYIVNIEKDTFLEPDPTTAGLVPWLNRKTAFFICDINKQDGTPLDFAPRNILKNVLSLYAEKGWQPVIAPEFEFTLLARDDKTQGPPAFAAPPQGKSGRLIVDKGALSLDGLAEFDALFEDIRRYCDCLDLPVDSMVQEAGLGQFELNVGHGEPMRMADASFHFKRLVRRAAVERGLNATFMAMPYPGDFGNAMHIHQSVVDAETGVNVFADDNGKDTALFGSHIAGLQAYTPAAMPIFAPYVNSYLRLTSKMASPVNTHWGVDNRSVGLRVPEGRGHSRRIENRIPGSDVNPYLAIAASLLCGYLGMVEGLKPTEPITRSAYSMDTNCLPQNIHAALDALEQCHKLRDILGDAFVSTFLDVKRAEIRSRSSVISPWDLKYLLTNV